MLNVKFTYFQNLEKNNSSIELNAPIPDIPVNRLSWSLFYPDSWAVRKSSGDFSTFHQIGLKKEHYLLTKSQPKGEYSYLQEMNNRRKEVASQGDIPTIGLSAKYIVGKRMLIVDESPVWKITFISKNRIKLIYTILIVIGLSIIGFVIFKFLNNNKGSLKNRKLD